MGNDVEAVILKNIPKSVCKNGFKDCKVIIFGAGGDGLRTYSMLKKYDIQVDMFSDNNQSKWGKTIGNDRIPCISPDEIKQYENVIAIIGTRNYTMPIAQQLKNLGIMYMTSDSYLFYRELEKVEKVYEKILSDPISKKVYLTLIEIMSSGNFDLIPQIYSDNQYFSLPAFALHKLNDTFVDCGASVGDSMEQFIYKRLGAFHKIYSFEPCDRPYNAMLKRKERLVGEWGLDGDSIECIKAGVSDRSSEVYLDLSGSLGENFVEEKNDTCIDEKITIIALDNYFKDIPEKITFIKADIEGYELRMLKGAKTIITRDKPNLAICIYHKFEDFFEIPLFIKSLVPEYNMEVRHHQFNLWETVLYCYL